MPASLFSAGCASWSFLFCLPSLEQRILERLQPAYILSPAIVPIFIALARFLQTKNKVYELTTERLKITEGIFNKVTDTLELYRVKDLETRQPFWSRMCGLENVQVNTSDVSTPFVLLDAVPIKLRLGDKIRNAVENVRMQNACVKSISSDTPPVAPDLGRCSTGLGGGDSDVQSR